MMKESMRAAQRLYMVVNKKDPDERAVLYELSKLNKTVHQELMLNKIGVELSEKVVKEINGK